MTTYRRFQFNPYLMRRANVNLMTLLEELNGKVVHVHDPPLSDDGFQTVTMALDGGGGIRAFTVHNSELVPVDAEYEFHPEPTEGEPPSAE